MSNSFSESHGEQGVIDPIIEQIERLVVAVFDQLRQRPAVAGALFAAIVGAVIGSMLAASFSQRQTTSQAHMARRENTAVDARTLAAGALRLLENPLVRSFLFSMLARGFKRRLLS
jgi:hypothetical protein